MARRAKVPKVPIGTGPKSTLKNHSFPPFYACYLLRSLKSTRSRATYVGSTPHPPRRIRQHNGEIAAGAWRTKKNRPWVMTMNVFGFPSKLAALQFEWAWQHPHRSRNLRDGSGVDKTMFPRDMKSTQLKSKIQIVRGMLSVPPYNRWPLHVKLFTSEAVKFWNDAQVGAPNLPRGFSHTVELEGVDGKSGEVGSGRGGAIDVTDAPFTEKQISKFNELVDVSQEHCCSVCQQPVDIARQDPLTIAICPLSHCPTVSHMHCLGNKFLAEEQKSIQPVSTSLLGLIPRGGECPGCNHWTLWGDIVRAAYRRQKGGVVEVEAEANELSAEDDLEESDEDPDCSTGSAGSSKSDRSEISLSKSQKPRLGKRKPSKASVRRMSASGSESSSSLSTIPTSPRTRGRPRKTPLAPSVVGSIAPRIEPNTPSKATRARSKSPVPAPVVPRSRGRPRKVIPQDGPPTELSKKVSKPSTSKVTSRAPASKSGTKSQTTVKRKLHTSAFTSYRNPPVNRDLSPDTSLEMIDLTGI